MVFARLFWSKQAKTNRFAKRFIKGFSWQIHWFSFVFFSFHLFIHFISYILFTKSLGNCFSLFIYSFYFISCFLHFIVKFHGFYIFYDFFHCQFHFSFFLFDFFFFPAIFFFFCAFGPYSATNSANFLLWYLIDFRCDGCLAFL